MQHVQDSPYAAGTVIVPAASLARYSEFWLALESLQVPYGTRLICARGADIPHQLNQGVRGMSGEWCWFLGDDHTFEPGLLMALLAREKDAVLPLVPRRDPPFSPVLLHGPLAPQMRPYWWTALPAEGLFQLPRNDSAGQAGMLVRKPVLDRLGDPWFEGGKLTPGRLMEDMYFVQRLHDLGVEIWIDCDQVMGHIANLAVTPYRAHGRWYPALPSKRGPMVLEDPFVPVGKNVRVVG
jgi:hypothetical protein